MQIVFDFLLQYWYVGIIAYTVLYELVKFTIKKILGLVTFPLRAVFKIAFGNAKTMNYVLSFLLLVAIAVIIYLFIRG